MNTGCRDTEVCKLRWDCEVPVPISEIGSVFIIPGEGVKNGQDRLVVLNRIARAVIERQRGKHPTYVFAYNNKAMHHMLNNGRINARKKTGLNVRVHVLKHSFGRRLRSAGVSFEDRQDLLGHKFSRITAHYSTAELLNLWQAANKVCTDQNRPVLTLLKAVSSPGVNVINIRPFHDQLISGCQTQLLTITRLSAICSTWISVEISRLPLKMLSLNDKYGVEETYLYT